ncbi:exonuclease SbcCD subunit D [Lachnospiraceae bacterium 29-84]
MKFLHISDLHLGKRVNEFPMMEEQKYILGQILAAVDSEQAEAVIIAGDIYDKPIPSAEAVQVFDQFLTALADKEIKVFAISGNHDSAERIAFGAQLMRGRGVYLSPAYDGTVMKIKMEDAYGEIFVHLMPFIKPAVVRHALTDEPDVDLPDTYQQAVQLVISRMEVDKSSRNVLVAHQFVTGAGICESEDIMVGGIDNVDAELFDGFDYVALGHIHSPQSIRRETVRYCGTPLKYSFSEEKQQKSITVVEIKQKGEVRIDTVPLVARHDMRTIRGTYEEITTKESYQGTDTKDYLKITLTDEEDVLDAMQKLRIFYPNLMQLEYDNSRTKQDRGIAAAEELEQKSDLELFEEFYELQNNRPMNAEQAAYIRRLLEET